MWQGVNNGASGTPEGARQGRIVNSAVACAELCREARVTTIELELDFISFLLITYR